MKVLIVDDEPPARDRLRALLNRLPDYEPCGEAGNGIEALRLAASTQPDIVLLDMTIAGGCGGLETAALIRKIDPEAKCVVMSGYSDHEVMADPKKFGFCAVISKPFRLNEFGKTISEILQ